LINFLPIHFWSLDLAFLRLNNISTKLFKKGQKVKMEIIKIFKQLIFNFFQQLSWSQLLIYYGLFLYILFSSLRALVGIFASLEDCLSVFPLPNVFEDSVLQMNNRGTPDNYGFINPGTPNSPGGPGTPGGGFPPGLPGTHHTTTHIIHDDGSWSNGIRNLFIYGSGGTRLIMNARRGGTPSQQLFIISTTILAETASRLMINSLNNPAYLRAQIYNLRGIFRDNANASVFLESNELPGATAANSISTLPGSTVGGGAVSNTASILGSGSSSASVPGGTGEISKSMMGLEIDFAKIYDSVLSKIVNYLNYIYIYIFDPVQHPYTLDLMSNHIQNISILYLTAIILIFFIFYLM
jgi:hypothetical protein